MVGLIFRENDPNKIEGLLSHIQQVSPLVKSIWWAIHPDITASLNEDEYQFFNGTDPFLTEQANGLTFQISPGSFYQPNPAQAGKIFSQIPALADLSGKETVYDLYSGIGTLGLSVASGAGRVIGIEGSGSAVKDAIDNTRINGFTNSSFIRGDVLETFTPEFVEQHGKPDLVILDPPRSGTLIEIKKTILHAAPPKIIYLSCNPLSLARDLKMLTQAYQITSIQPFDQFPHTHHLETLVTLRLRSA
jgi:23S rRNA (uracil1939-C5)-methyltransferase